MLMGSKMTSVMVGVAMVMVCLPQVYSWGTLFNRFSPEMLNNGFSNPLSQYRLQPYIQRMNAAEGYASADDGQLAEQAAENACYPRKCSANEYCCPGFICIAVDGMSGECMFINGRKLGEICHRDSDCESALVCTEIIPGEPRICRPPITSAKQYAEECHMSSECDISRGLCCQLQRRHRQQPRKVCSYFKDPLVCIGPVAMDQIINNDIEHTAGEKRLTSYKTYLH